ncbi:MAG TPA: redox-regulated ATPase YchF [Actinobacteria bacterium]|nr:redox-regulated ATPase YchF [Actinomycetota bacterium]
MALRCGIVGLPNVGKSTIFNALTAAGIAAENYPFCTIEPNVGVAVVPDPRLDVLAEIVRPDRVVPTTVEFVDIAGLVGGASEGEGLGNRFLAHIREVDAVAHVVRCFEDPNVTHVAGTVDPAADIATIDTELALADLGTVERALERTRRQARAGVEGAAARLEVLERLEAALSAGSPVRSLELTSAEETVVAELFLLTAKPVLYVANVAEGAGPDDPLVEPVRKIAQAEGADLVVVSGELEAQLAAFDAEDRAELLAEYGLEEPGLHRVVRAAYRLLGLLTFFTTGPEEVRAWTVRRGATAPEAAGRIHTDFEKGFIRAEVVAYEDFVAHGGEQGAKEAGKWRLEGRDYVVAEGDVIRFRFNV